MRTGGRRFLQSARPAQNLRYRHARGRQRPRDRAAPGRTRQPADDRPLRPERRRSDASRCHETAPAVTRRTRPRPGFRLRGRRSRNLREPRSARFHAKRMRTGSRTSISCLCPPPLWTRSTGRPSRSGRKRPCSLRRTSSPASADRQAAGPCGRSRPEDPGRTAHPFRLLAAFATSCNAILARTCRMLTSGALTGPPVAREQNRPAKGALDIGPLFPVPSGGRARLDDDGNGAGSRFPPPSRISPRNWHGRFGRRFRREPVRTPPRLQTQALSRIRSG